MGIYVVKNGPEFMDADFDAANIDVYLAAFKSGTGRLGFDCAVGDNKKAIDLLIYKRSRYFSYGKYEMVSDPGATDLLRYFRSDLKLGAFLFVGVGDEFEKYERELESYAAYLKKKKIMERHDKSIDALRVPLLATLYDGESLNVNTLKELLGCSRFCIQAKYSDFGLYLYIYSLSDIDLGELFAVSYEMVEHRSDIPCW